MHDILNGFINDWSRKVMASKAFLLVSTLNFLASYHGVPVSGNNSLRMHLIKTARYYA